MIDDPGAVAAAIERAAGDRVRKRQAQKRRRRITSMFTVISLLFVGGFGYLAWLGADAARNVRGGTTANSVTDASEPGFVATVDATQVSLVAMVDGEGVLDSMLLFPEPTDDGSTTIVWTLGELLIDRDGVETALRDIYAAEGIEAAVTAYEDIVGFSAGDVITAQVGDVESIAGIIAPIEVTNPNRITVEVNGENEVRYPGGALELDAVEAADYLTVRSAGEASEDRGIRAGQLLMAMGSSLAELVADQPVDEAEVPADFGALLIRWGAGDHQFMTLPVDPVEFKGTFLYRADAQAIRDELSGVVPFPVSAYPGQRPRIRILNGTADTTQAAIVAPDLAGLGAEVSLIGNATSFDVVDTGVVYSDEAFADVAQRIAEFLGTTATQTDVPSDATDIDVVLGADLTR